MNRDEHLLKKTTRAYYSTKKDILYVIHKTQLIKKYLSPPPPPESCELSFYVFRNKLMHNILQGHFNF